MTALCEDDARKWFRDRRRLVTDSRQTTLRLGLLFAVLALGLALWVSGFHHHDSDGDSADCAMCVAADAHSWDLPTATVAPRPALLAEPNALGDEATLKIAPGVGREQCPRGPPLA